MSDAQAQCHLTVDSNWGTHICSQDDARTSKDGHVCLHGGRESVNVAEEFPNRVVQRMQLDTESIPPDARAAAAEIMSAYRVYHIKKRRLSVHPPAVVLPAAVREAFARIRHSIEVCCEVGAARHEPTFWDIPPESTFRSVFENGEVAVARLKMVNSLVVHSSNDGCGGFATAAAKMHYDYLQYEACAEAVAGQQRSMTIRIGDVVSVQLDSRCAYSFTGAQHDHWVVKEIFIDTCERLRLDCQVLVHPGDHDGHLRGHGQSSFEALQHKPWPLWLFRERTVDMAKEMAGAHARALATANARLMVERHRQHTAEACCMSDGLLAHTDVPAPPDGGVQVPELSMPKNLALARHGRAGDSRELFLLSDAAQARMRTLIGIEHVRSVVQDVQFLRHDQAPPANGATHCKFVQHAADWKYTDLLPPQVPRCNDNEHERRPLKLFAGAGGLDHAAPEPGWTVDMCASSCLTIKANKPEEEVYHMGVEEFNAMCCSMHQLEAQLRSNTSEEVRARDMAESAAYSQVKGQASSLRLYLRDDPESDHAKGSPKCRLNNAQAVAAVLSLVTEMGSFKDRQAKRVKQQALFENGIKVSLMQAIQNIAALMHSEHAAEHKAEVEVLQLDELFIDVYLPQFMQVYSLAFASAFVSVLQGGKASAPTAEGSQYAAWELSLACVTYLLQSETAGCIPSVHEAVCRAVARPTQTWIDHSTPRARAAGIDEVLDFRMADAAKRFSTAKSKGFLMQKLMRAETQLFFCCKVDGASVWLNTDEVLARDGQRQLLSFIVRLRTDRRLPWPGGVSAILAGPPCQDISNANPHSSKRNIMDTDQVRNNMVFPLLDAIECFQPSFVVVEQVPVALSTDKRAYATTVQHQLLTLGYQTHVRLINSKDCGAPQKRMRMFVLAAARGKLLPHFPSPIPPLKRNRRHIAQTQQAVVAGERSDLHQSEPEHRTASSELGTVTGDTSLGGGSVDTTGDHDACLWDVVSDLPHVGNAGFLGMIPADSISKPRSVLQHYNAIARLNSRGLPDWLCFVLGAGPYMVMSARLILQMELTSKERDAALRLLSALQARQMVADRFEAVLGQSISDDAMRSLQAKVHMKMASPSTRMAGLKHWQQIKEQVTQATSARHAEECQNAMDCLAMLANQAAAERSFCAVLCSIASTYPSAQAEGFFPKSLLKVVQRQLCHATAVAARALEEVRQLDCEGSAMEVADWHDHDLRGLDGLVRRWSCFGRLQRVILTPTVCLMHKELTRQLQSIDDMVGSSCTCTGPGDRDVWVMNHIPVHLTMHDESVIASMPPWRPDFRSLHSLTASMESSTHTASARAAPHKPCTQLLPSGRPARTPAFLKSANSYRRAHLHSVPATVTTVPRVQTNATDAHPVLDRTLSVLELKRCQGFPDDYALLAFPDAVEDHYSGSLKLEAAGGTRKACAAGSGARNEGLPISLRRGFSMLLGLVLQENSMWSLHTSQARNLWRLIGNAVCVLVARQLRVGLQAATQALAHSGGTDADMHEQPAEASMPVSSLASLSPAVTGSHASANSRLELHKEWQEAVNLHLAAPGNAMQADQGRDRTAEEPPSLLQNAYNPQYPDFLKTALRGKAHSQAPGAPTSGVRSSAAVGCYRLPYGIHWDGPEVQRLAKLWHSTPQPLRWPPTHHRRSRAAPAAKAGRKRGSQGRRGRGGTHAAHRSKSSSSDSERSCASVSESEQSSTSSSTPGASESTATDSDADSQAGDKSCAEASSESAGAAAALPRLANAPDVANPVQGFLKAQTRQPRASNEKLPAASRARLDNMPDPLYQCPWRAAGTQRLGPPRAVGLGKHATATKYIDLTAGDSGDEAAHDAAGSPAPPSPPAAPQHAAWRTPPSGTLPSKRFRLRESVAFRRWRLEHVQRRRNSSMRGSSSEVKDASPARSVDWLPGSGACRTQIAQAVTASHAYHMAGPGQEVMGAEAATRRGSRAGHAQEGPIAADAEMAELNFNCQPDTANALADVRDQDMAPPEEVAAAPESYCVSEMNDKYGYNAGFGQGNEYVGAFALDSE
eukprot:jgi/Ulvmu1/4450/UM002_0175.1